MLSYFSRVGKAATVAAMTVGVALVATPVQKAAAQVVGAGDSTITTLVDVVRGDARLTDFGTRYVINGSGAGRTSFLSGQTQHAATSGGLSFLQLGVNTGQLVAFQEVTNSIAFPYNVPGFDVTVDGETGCRIFRGDANQGDPTNWNQVTNILGETGPNLPIRRVVRGDVSGTTATLQGTGFGTGFIELCGVRPTPIVIPPIVGPGTTTTNGTIIPNAKPVDIVVPGNAAPLTSGDDRNPNNYTNGILRTVAQAPGAIGYAESAAANFAIANPDAFGGQITGLVASSDVTTSTGVPATVVAVGPAFTVFDANQLATNLALQNLCLAITDTNNILAAGFNEVGVDYIDADGNVAQSIPSEVGPDAVPGGNPACGPGI